MSGWQPGDLALCVNMLGSVCPEITKGGVYTVEAVTRGWNCRGIERLGLTLVGVMPSAEGAIAFDAAAFRKIPPHEADDEDRETIRLLTGKPVREPVA